MKYKALTVIIVFIFSSFLIGSNVASAQESEQSFICSVFGWMIKPLGLCVEPVIVTVVTEEKDIFPIIEESNLLIEKNKLAATTTVIKEVTNEYVTIQNSGITKEELDIKIQELLEYINAKPQTVTPQQYTFYKDILNDSATKEYVIKTADKTSEQISRSIDSIEESGVFDSPTLTDAILSGTSYVTDFLGVGTTSPSEILTVDGAIYLDESLPTNITNRLYNLGGNLYWNGSVVTSSTTSNWSTLLGNAYRLTGNVGIGTSTPNDTLSVIGTISAGTTTARIVDTGGQVCNVEAYGAVGDDSTLNDDAIARAIASCPEGGVVFFPMGEFRVSRPIILDKPITLRGSYSPRWSYSSTPRSSIRADFNTFSGDALVHVRDKLISGEVEDNNGGRIENLSLDGGSAGTDVNGIYFEGLVRDWKLTDVDISQVTGNGFEAAVGTGSGNPRGFTIRGLSIYSSDGHGFRATALNDSYIEDLLVVGNSLRGIYLSSMGETKINSSRAVFNGLTGLYIDGSSNNGGLTFTDFSTDRNDRHGVRISSTGTSTIIFNGLLTRRDGANTSGGSETPYAGIAIIGSTTAKVSPVFITGLAQVVGVDDQGNPPLSPDVGVRVINAEYVKIDGQLWGVTDAYIDGGGNDNFIIEDDSVLKTGTDGTQELYENVRKWTATSSGLFYGGGRVNIGSSTGSRLLNIIAPSQAGARFQDTTNNVIFDMRAEDYQGFFGTFSNHQLRFQTNNASRLTIDTNGYIGIGTTTPDQLLDVMGTIQADNLTGGTVNLITDANGNIIRDTSDERLKTNIKDVEDSLSKVLNLRGVTYEWKDKERFGSQTEMGFIAQEVDEIVPEVVRKGGDYWSIDTRNILAIVVEAIQEMWDTVTGNRNRINELEDRVKSLESLLEVETELKNESDEQTYSKVEELIEQENFDLSKQTASNTPPIVSEESVEIENVSEPESNNEEEKENEESESNSLVEKPGVVEEDIEEQNNEKTATEEMEQNNEEIILDSIEEIVLPQHID